MLQFRRLKQLNPHGVGASANAIAKSSYTNNDLAPESDPETSSESQSPERCIVSAAGYIGS